MENFSSDLSKISDLPLSALEKAVTATICCFNSNPGFLFFCSDKFFIATNASSLNSGKSIIDSNQNTAGESLSDVGAISTCNRFDIAKLIAQKHHLFLR